jgi:hypothetical protein
LFTLTGYPVRDTLPEEHQLFSDDRAAIFAGSVRGEHIEMWDLRARASVYVLGTGNNAVMDMAWDSGRNVLYAATECNYVDRFGYHYEYRPARLPKEQRTTVVKRKMKERGDETDESEDDDDYDDAGGKCWPDQAHHNEDHFGYMFDAGFHAICEIENVIYSTRLTRPS